MRHANSAWAFDPRSRSDPENLHDPVERLTQALRRRARPWTGSRFAVGRGEIVGLLGPNGAGKTTTMRMLTTFLPPTSGRARRSPGTTCSTSRWRSAGKVGYLPENVPLYPEMRVREYLTFRAKLKDVPRVEAARRRSTRSSSAAGSARSRTGSSASSRRGYRQRVGLAEAMVHDPDILILDEPTAGLDPIQIREVRALIRELGDRHTILLSTHIMSEVEAVCGRVIIIARGRIAVDEHARPTSGATARSCSRRGGRPRRSARSWRRRPGSTRVDADRTRTATFAAFEVQARDGADLREALGQRVVQNGWPLRQLDLRRDDAGRPVHPGRHPRDRDRRRRTRGRLTMRHVPTLLRRELGAYFLGPMAFLILLAFQVIAWLNFWELVDSLSRPQQSLSEPARPDEHATSRGARRSGSPCWSRSPR